MASIPQVIEKFLTELAFLPDEGGHALVCSLVQPAIVAEQKLRVLFVQQPDHPALEDLFIGLIDVFATPVSIRRARPRPLAGIQIGYAFVPDRPCLFPQHDLLPLHPYMRRCQASPAIVNDLKEFRENWEIFTHGALSKITDWTNIVAAGGSVLACLLPMLPRPSNVNLNKFYLSDAYVASDIDLFLWGLSAEEAQVKMDNIFNAIKIALPWTTVCVRKLNTISIHTSFLTRPIQIILLLYCSPGEILAGFDIDCACCLYDGENIYVSPHALAACICQSNTVNMTRRSSSYEVRLAKYADRDFEVHLPILDYLYDSDLAAYPKGLGRLVVLELIRRNQYHYPKIYRPRQPSFTTIPEHPQAMDFKPVEKSLLKNNYDSSWICIPYKNTWDAERVMKFVKDIDSGMNSEYNEKNNSRRLHRHTVFCGTMIKCLADFCPSCPLPINDEEREMIVSESTKFFRGAVQFIQTNPGCQMISGSFNPLDIEDWFSGVITDDISDHVHSVYIHEADYMDYDQEEGDLKVMYSGDLSEMHVSDSEDELDHDILAYGEMEESEGSAYYSFGDSESEVEFD